MLIERLIWTGDQPITTFSKKQKANCRQTTVSTADLLTETWELALLSKRFLRPDHWLGSNCECQVLVSCPSLHKIFSKQKISTLSLSAVTNFMKKFSHIIISKLGLNSPISDYLSKFGVCPAHLIL